MDDLSALASKLWNVLSATAIIGTIAGWFPYAAGVIGATYYLIQIYESNTLQGWLQSRRIRKIAQYKKSMAALEAQELKAAARRQVKIDKASGL